MASSISKALQGPYKGLECPFLPLFPLPRTRVVILQTPWPQGLVSTLRAPRLLDIRLPFLLETLLSASNSIFKEPIWVLNNLFYFVFLCVYFVKRKDSTCGCIHSYLKLWLQIILQIYAHISSLAIFAFNYRIPSSST